MKLEVQWIVGFIDGVGEFDVSVSENQIKLQFIVKQHEEDVQILHALKAHFSCGVVRNSDNNKMSYNVKEIEHLSKIIVPFFEKHLLKTKKRIDFEKFRDIIIKMQRGDHLTPEGIEEIRAIKEEMNRGKLR